MKRIIFAVVALVVAGQLAPAFAQENTIALGRRHSCALTAAGAARCWGDNEFGQIGDGTFTDRLTPTAVIGLGAGLRSISGFYDHTCAVTSAGEVKCWGSNLNGILGDGSQVNRSAPVTVTGFSSGAEAAGVGAFVTCIITDAGALKCWGYNEYGAVGDGTNSNRLTPVAVVGLGAGVAAVAMGGNHTCALTTGGAVKCWGRNAFGQLGDGTTTDRNVPVSVVGLSSGVVAISAGDTHVCVLLGSGGMKCWGRNATGALGDGTTTDRWVPGDVSGLPNGIPELDAGLNSTFVRTPAGGVLGWGANGDGQLGDGTLIHRSLPVQVSGLSSGISTVAGGAGHSCARRTSGELLCWGLNIWGQVGDGSTTDRLTPVTVYIDTAGTFEATDQFLWMVPPSSNTQQQGFLRLTNRSASAGLVTVWGLDAAGARSPGTIALTLAARESRQFNSQDLEQGNTSKGLTGSLGSGTGAWTVIVRTGLDLEALTYIRTPDGFLTTMHDRVVGNGVDWNVPMFNPADNPNQVSHLRLVNTNASSVSVQISGIDDSGASSDGTVTVTLPALSSKDLTSADLENGNSGKGLMGSLGGGFGKWRLLVSSTGRLTVQSLLYDPLGKITNLSTAASGAEVAPGQRVLWLVTPASSTQQQGFIRITNRSNSAGTVTLRGVDDAGNLSPGTATFSLAARASMQFNSQDLELGNTGKGLTGSLGDGVGNWRLLITSSLDLQNMGLIRTPDGFLTTVHDVVAGSGSSGDVVIFNPAENPNQVSVLRVVNPNNAAVTVTFSGIDDAGASGAGLLTLALASGAAKELSATDLESGNAGLGLSGSLGNGTGKWRLHFEATAPVKLLSLLRDPNGYLTDLSTAAKGGSGKLDP